MVGLFLGEPNSDMGSIYWDSLLNAYTRIHSHLFGKGKSIVSYIIEEITKDFSPEEVRTLSELSQNFLRNFAELYQITEAWLFWPITAGGLGLHHALLNTFISKPSLCDHSCANDSYLHSVLRSLLVAEPPANFDHVNKRFRSVKEQRRYEDVEYNTLEKIERRWVYHNTVSSQRDNVFVNFFNNYFSPTPVSLTEHS
jgi:hypothetical protein